VSTSRREFLRRVLAMGGTVAAAGAVPGCARRVDPAPVADVPEPVHGKLALNVDRYPDLVREGGAIMARAQGLETPVLVTRLSGDTFTALSALCPHAGCPVGYVPENGEVECPCHGSRFDPVSGEVLNPPARTGLSVYATQFDPGLGLLVIDLVAGDPGFPAVVAGRVTLPLSDYPQLATPSSSVVGIPRGLGRPLVVVALADGGYSAVDGTCTHMGCTVAHSPERASLDCPCHGASFTVEGEVTRGPATRPLRRFSADRVGDAVVVKVF